MNRALPLAGALVGAALALTMPGEPFHTFALEDEVYSAPVTDPRGKQLPDAWECPQGTCLDSATWHPVPSDWADALAESEAGSERDWAVCWLSIGDTSYVVCPDGTVWTS